MLQLTFTVQDLARTRLVVSPLWEIVASIRLLKSPRARTFHQHWAVTVEQRIARSGADLGLLFDLVDPGTWYLANFLSPAPQGPVPDLKADLDAFRRLTPDQVRSDLDVLAYARKNPVGSLDEASLPRKLIRGEPGDLPSVAVAELHADPAAGISRLADQLHAYWDLAIGPYWGRIRALLEGDLLHRGRMLGLSGPAGLFNGLADTVRWRNDSLLIQHRRFRGVRHLAGEGLLVTPSAFVWPQVYTSSIPPWPPTLTYPARGIATLWEAASTEAPAGLSNVLGRSRAKLLAQLDTPRSTSELATHTGLTAAAVSQHLSALRAAGLVTSHRTGRLVLYARTRAAEVLLTAADHATAGPLPTT